MKNSRLTFDKAEPKKLNINESLLTLSNTYMGIRGSEDELPEGSIPGLYIAGIFDKSEYITPEMVAFPGLFTLQLMIGDQEISADTCKIISYTRSLEFYNGTVLRGVIYELPDGRQLKLESTRFLSFHDTHCGAVSTIITPLNFSGEISVTAVFDATLLSRNGIYSYEEKVKHFHLIQISDQYEDDLLVRARTRDRGILVDFCSSLTARGGVDFRRQKRVYGELIHDSISLQLQENIPVTIDRFFAVEDSRELKKSALRDSCRGRLERMKNAGFQAELDLSVKVLTDKWRQADVRIEGDDANDLALRFNVFQLIGLGNSLSSRFAIGAKGLTTEFYWGHYFWDTEAFMVPYYLFTDPQVAFNLLEFRTRTLSAACKNAKRNGFAGCLWPWQSDDLGNEGIRPMFTENGAVIRRDVLDQYHIVSDVAWAALQYLYISGDDMSFRRSLVPLIVEGLRFWQSFLYKQNDPGAKEYHMWGIMGPDEYHAKVDDNYYTSCMTKTVFRHFFDYYENIDDRKQYEIREANGLSEAELTELKTVGEKIFLPKIRDGVIEQFSGYFKLRDIIIDKWNEKGLPLYPDQSVGEGMEITERQEALLEDATTTQLIKQADALQIICQDPSSFSAEITGKSYDYYNKRTLQFSSLSPGVYAYAAALAGQAADALGFFTLAVNMDLADIKDETHEGLHTAGHGAVYQCAVKGFAGIRLEKDYINIAPCLPDTWQKVSFSLRYRGMYLDFEVSPSQVRIRLNSSGKVILRYQGKDSLLVSDGSAETVISL